MYCWCRNIPNTSEYAQTRKSSFTDLSAINHDTIDTINLYINLKYSTNTRIVSYTVREYYNGAKTRFPLFDWNNFNLFDDCSNHFSIEISFNSFYYSAPDHIPEGRLTIRFSKPWWIIFDDCNNHFILEFLSIPFYYSAPDHIPEGRLTVRFSKP